MASFHCEPVYYNTNGTVCSLISVGIAASLQYLSIHQWSVLFHPAACHRSVAEAADRKERPKKREKEAGSHNIIKLTQKGYDSIVHMKNLIKK